MSSAEQTKLQKRLARLIADRLARECPDKPAPLRLWAAHKAAERLVIRAKWGGKIVEFQYNMDSKLAAPVFEI
jgi:hypothetical protein